MLLINLILRELNKAIREGKINNLIKTERNNPALMKAINMSKRSSTIERPKHIDSPDNEKIDKARNKKKEISAKVSLYPSTNDLDSRMAGTKTTQNAKNFSYKRRTIDSVRTDPLTPFELKAIKDQLIMDSTKKTKNVNNLSQVSSEIYKSFDSLKGPSYNKSSYLSRIQLSQDPKPRKLSPRLQEF